MLNSIQSNGLHQPTKIQIQQLLMLNYSFSQPHFIDWYSNTTIVNVKLNFDSIEYRKAFNSNTTIVNVKLVLFTEFIAVLIFKYNNC